MKALAPTGDMPPQAPSAVPGSARRSRAYRWIRNRALRIGVPRPFWFLVLLFLGTQHAIRRRSAPELANSEHNRTPLGFLRLALQRYRAGTGRSLSFALPNYLSQAGHAYRPDSRLPVIRAAPGPAVRLKFANILKAQGLFDDAEMLLRELAACPRVRLQALLDLGDLLLLQACWAREVRSYKEDGVVIGLEAFGKSENIRWQARTFEEAIAVLEDALALCPTSRDGLRLLCWALAEAELWKEAQTVLHRYLRVTEHGEQGDQFLRARILFGEDAASGLRACEAALGARHGWWRVSAARIADDAMLPTLPGVEVWNAGAAVSATVRSHVVQNREITEVSATLHFDAPHVARYDDAEILPRFGMILANGNALIASSLHQKRCHWRLFAEPVQALAGERALVCRKSPLQYAGGTCCFPGRNANYYHWLLEVLPRLALARNEPSAADVPILVDAGLAGWQTDLLARFGIGPERLRVVGLSECVRVRDLFVPSHLSSRMVAHPHAVDLVRRQLAPHANTMTPKRGKRVYLTRGSATERRTALQNENALLPHFRRAGFIFADPGAMSIEAQIAFFSDAEIIAAPGGAALTNAIFAPAQARILQLTASGMRCETFSSISSAIGQEHWACIGPSYPRPYSAWVWSVFDFEIDEADLKLCLARIL